MEIKEVKNPLIKSQISDEILHKLEEWFEIEASIQDYIESVKDKPFFAVYEKEEPIGFICIKYNNPYTADIHVLGILKAYHRKGIGKKLMDKVETFLKKEGYKFLMVKTLGTSQDEPFYQKTRLFYEKVGFYPLEEFTEIWDENNPCLIMIKTL